MFDPLSMWPSRDILRGIMKKPYSDSYSVYLDKTEAAKSIPDQPCQYEYPGRALPPVNNSVPDAKNELNSAVRLAKEQTGLNRYPINEHVEKHKSHGPNN